MFLTTFLSCTTEEIIIEQEEVIEELNFYGTWQPISFTPSSGVEVYIDFTGFTPEDTFYQIWKSSNNLTFYSSNGSESKTGQVLILWRLELGINRIIQYKVSGVENTITTDHGTWFTYDPIRDELTAHDIYFKYLQSTNNIRYKRIPYNKPQL